LDWPARRQGIRTFPSLLPALAVVSLVCAAPASAQTADLLPDLVQVTPSSLNVKQVNVTGRPKFRLGFASATENRGKGPLTVHGFRPYREVRTMQVDQLVRQTDGTSRLVRSVGGMQYVHHPDHQHWHFVGFVTYTLRALAAPDQMRRDRKTGFCLGDRYVIRGGRSLSGYDPAPSHADLCGMRQPGLEGLFAGISVGYADRYEAHLEGQFVDLTGLPEGRYVLTHTVNPEGTLVESDYSDNASSLLVGLRWLKGPNKLPRVRVWRRCPGAASCDP
jgi:hypothetical protein